MGTYNSAVITNGGQSMIAQAVAGASLEFTVIKTSNYAYPAGTNLATLTTINGIKQSKDITGAAVYNSRVIKISAAVDNTGISTAYTINTIGIYAKVGSSAESLFAVVTASAADTMPAYDSKPYSYIYEINLTMQNAANVTVAVNAAGLVNVVDLNAAKVEIRGEIADLKSALNSIANVMVDDDTLTANAKWYINYSTGSIGVAKNTHCSGTNRLPIPSGCSKIVFPSIGIASVGVAGWATYRANTGTETGDYLRGAQSRVIEVQSTDKYFAVTNVNESGTASTSIEVIYYFGKINETTAQNTSDISAIISGNLLYKTVSVALTSGLYWNSTTGVSGSVQGYSATGNRVAIPDGCVRIVFPSVKYNFAGAAGWAVYSSNTGTEAGDYIRGGQNGYINIGTGEKYFTLTTYGTPASIDVIYIFSTIGEMIFDTQYPLSDKMLCFVGDSITYGYDDSAGGAQLSNPFPDQISSILNACVANEGVSSASLMNGTMSGGGHTPRAWVTYYTNLSNSYDIIGTMIGINDAYRNYTLGEMSDRTADTFYGALHIYWLGMTAKYPPENGKRLFCMLYPQYDSSYASARYANFRTALIEVANYYSIPILDLAHELGVSCYADSNYTYWAQITEGHSPHLTQTGANVVAPVVANFIKRMFS